jgi:hypothetical protein
MGWYTGYKVIVHFLDEKHNNGDRLDEFTKNMKDRNLVKLICIEKKWSYDTWCGCGNTDVELLANSWVLTTTLKKGVFEELLTIVNLIKYFLKDYKYIYIEGEAFPECNEYSRICIFTKIKYDLETDKTEFR